MSSDRFEEAGRSALAYEFSPKLHRRHRTGKLWTIVFKVSTVVGIVALVLLLANISNSAFGYVLMENKINPQALVGEGQKLSTVDKDTLVVILKDNVSAGLYRRFEHDMSWEDRTREDVYNLVLERVVAPKVNKRWSLYESLTQRDEIMATAAQFPNGDLSFRSWLDIAFLTRPQSADALRAGVRTAILGSLWCVGIAIVFAFPIGVGAAIYLEEYAQDTKINRLIQTNINNLSGVPSIIYGILGLAIFVRTLEVFTSGLAFGVGDATTANGRTVLSAGMTLGLWLGLRFARRKD